MLLLPLLLLAQDGAVDFKRDVRPILSENCFQCHGPDEKRREAKLRLDTKEGATADLDGTFAVVPGNIAKSELHRRITTDDVDDRMPPAKTGKKLSAAQIVLIRKWIEQGAKWSDHWAFVPPERAPVPKAAHPVDAFIQARLEREGLSFSPEGDKVTLLRRLSLDLTGLPPSAAELDAFLADGRPGAWERQVDRLLASPHHGERWARHWLDAARYADSDGYEKDKQRQVWFYRDWVVGAINRDLPYDRFIVEQLAGDLLPDATQDQRVATGFLRNSMINEEGGVDPEQFRMEAMFDRMDAIGKSVLGLTVQCAQCHSHKYDPLTHEDYYRMFAFLNNDDEANIPAYGPAEQQSRAEIFRKIREIEDGLRHKNADWPERLARWEVSMKAGRAEWTVVVPAVDDISTGGQKYLPLADGSYLAQGYAPTKHKVKMTAKTELQKITGFRLELLNDPNLPLGGPGRSPKGAAALTEFEVEASAADGSQKAKLKFVRATSDFDPAEQPLEKIFDDKSNKKRITGPVAFAIDGKQETAWGTDAGPGRRNVPRQAVFVPEKPVAFPGGALLVFHLQQNHGGWNSDDNQSHNLGRMRLSITGSPEPTADPLSPAAREALGIDPSRRTPAQQAALFAAFRVTVVEWKDANDRIEDLWKQHPEGSSQLVLADREMPRMTSLLKRGDFLKPDRAVKAGGPAFLHPVPAGAPVSRLTFARWLVDRKSPTAARAAVNRAWQAYFGTGLVRTSEDFGSQGEQPSHMELLDWLAVEFMEQGWSQKKLHRLIVTSRTYRQSSRVTRAALERDPENRLLARGPRFRVEGEIVRDIALAASGLLNLKVGGPSVYPPAPASLFLPPASYGPKVWIEEKGDERFRRGLYTFRYRSVPHPALQVFDTPNGDFSCVKRPRSNTPLQALTTLNEPLFVECARGLARLALREGGAADADRLAYAFRRCTSRMPSAEESALLLGLLKRQADRFAGGGADPKELAGTLGTGEDAAALAAWTAVARVLLNLDETITKE